MWRAAWAAVVACATAMAAYGDTRQYTFAWPFEEGGAMRPRGGTSRGVPVELAKEPSDAWRALREPGLSPFERDRRAILAMAGGFRTTFDFIETAGFTPGFEPDRPYQSWATEYVYVAEDRGDFIRLQHLLVMFYVDRHGEVQGPIVQKHWRQDWTYEDTDLHVYTGHNRWRRRVLEPEAVKGRWSQAVFQVDDSPRYEAVGTWVHEGNYSAWTSELTWRPLPRRESSVRDDYHVLAGTNRHTITPTGWVQEEDNLKLALGSDGQPAKDQPYLAREVGLARYERVTNVDFSAGDRYAERTGQFWADVRDAWADIYAERDEFGLAEEVDGRPLFEPLFDYAERLYAGEAYDPADGRAFIRATLSAYLR
ncbi:MAG TPA: DUF6607 family protein [Gammaproteobacteria bacterium]